MLRQIRAPSSKEAEVKGKFKKNYLNKKRFTENRVERNEQYVKQRKLDFSLTQSRVQRLVDKLKDEYEENISEALKTCQKFSEDFQQQRKIEYQNICNQLSQNISKSSAEFLDLYNILSFIPSFFSDLIPSFYDLQIPFDITYEGISDFLVNVYKVSLPWDFQKVVISLFSAFGNNKFLSPIISRKVNSICILSKPLTFTDQQKLDLAKEIGWKPLLGQSFDDPVSNIFEELKNSDQNLLIFDFPRTFEDFYQIQKLFSYKVSNKELVQTLSPPDSNPFDLILFVDVTNEVILRDIYSVFVDKETNAKLDIRNLDLSDEKQITRIVPAEDGEFDISQFPSRTGFLNQGYELIKEHAGSIYHQIPLSEREINQDLLDSLSTFLEKVEKPIEPESPLLKLDASLIDSASYLSDDMKTVFVDGWLSVQSNYDGGVTKIFQVINSTRQLLVQHLRIAREELNKYLRRPSNSQQHITEFQIWHSTQVKRSMRKLPKVKEECNYRINALREILLQIENDRKSDEEVKQKDLLNAPFQQSLFEIVTNSFTLLVQAEFDRWHGSRIILSDFNQMISKLEPAQPLQRKKLQISLDVSKANAKGKSAKKTPKPATNAKGKVDGKIPVYDSPLYENIEQLKKHVSDSSATYIPIQTPTLTTRTKAKPVKDKSPFALNRITALDEFISAFKEDDTYFVAKLNEIVSMLKLEIETIHRSFEAFIEESTGWIQAHYENRKSIADTAIAYLLSKVEGGDQLNYFIALDEDNCTIDKTRLFTENEKPPVIPPTFSQEILTESTISGPEAIFTKIFGLDEPTPEEPTPEVSTTEEPTPEVPTTEEPTE